MVLFGTEKRILAMTNSRRPGPGPGSYHNKGKTTSSKVRTEPAYSMGGASRELGNTKGPIKALHANPGPGEYETVKKAAIGTDAR